MRHPLGARMRVAAAARCGARVFEDQPSSRELDYQETRSDTTSFCARSTGVGCFKGSPSDSRA